MLIGLRVSNYSRSILNETKYKISMGYLQVKKQLIVFLFWTSFYFDSDPTSEDRFFSSSSPFSLLLFGSNLRRLALFFDFAVFSPSARSLPPKTGSFLRLRLGYYLRKLALSSTSLISLLLLGSYLGRLALFFVFAVFSLFIDHFKMIRFLIWQLRQQWPLYSYLAVNLYV